MKQIFKIGLITMVMMLSGPLAKDSKAQWWSASISFQSFYDELSPYGNWINSSQYGYVWSPSDRYDFHPYRSHGHWAWTDSYGWLWVSDYEWGWAPFHYGRWYDDPYYGWLWVPDYEWSPAWVTWRSGGDYYGWAPMRPGLSISLSFGNDAAPYDYWSFVPRQYISSYEIPQYYISVQQNITIINNTTIINNYTHNNNVYVTGPRREEAERYTRTRIQPVRIRDGGKPGKMRTENNEVVMYKPKVARQVANREAPKKYQTYNKDNRDHGNRDPGARDTRQDRTPDPVTTDNKAAQQKQQEAIRRAQQDNARQQQDNIQKKQQQDAIQKKQQQDQQRQQQDNIQKRQQQDAIQKKQQQDNIQKRQQQDAIQKKQQQDNIQKRQQQDAIQKKQQQDQQRQQQDNIQKRQQQDAIQKKQQQDNIQRKQQQDAIQKKQQQDQQRQKQDVIQKKQPPDIRPMPPVRTNEKQIPPPAKPSTKKKNG